MLLSQFPNIIFGMSTRQGGPPNAPSGLNLGVTVHDEDPGIQESLIRFFGQLGLSPDDGAFMEQAHTDVITDVDEPGIYPSTDALITTMPGVALVIRTADCAPVSLYVPSRNLIAVVHAGWKGTAAGITGSTVRQILSSGETGPEEIFAYLGPSARACCYEVDEDTAACFPEAALTRRDGAPPRLDLAKANLLQLAEAGIPDENIETDRLCTICNPSLLHSHRRDAELSGRMLTVLCLREEL
jgi:polyphenol oxidase